MTKPQLSILVLAFNESVGLRATVRNVINAANSVNKTFEIIIVNDASLDDTDTIANQLLTEFPEFIKVINNEHNLGQGKSLLKALNICKGENFAWLPGDNVIELELVKAMFQNSGHADLVTTYLLNQEVRGKFRFFMSVLYTLIYNISFNQYLQYFNGPGVYNTLMLKNLDLKSDRFSFSAEIHLKILRMGGSFIEIPGYLSGAENSSAIAMENFYEVIKAYIRNLMTIYIFEKNKYCHTPKRIRLQP